MRYLPSDITDADLAIAKSAFFGGEFAVYLSQTPAVMLGELKLSASGTGVWLPAQGAVIKAAGSDLQVVPVTPVNSAVKPIFTLDCMDNTPTTPVAMDGVATFEPPARAGNQTYNFARGFAVDLIPATAGKLFTGITGLAETTPVVGGGVNQVFRVYQLPEASDYELIEATTEVTFNVKDRMPKGIDAGMEADYWMKRGKSAKGELSISSKYRSFVEGMARYSGQKSTVMLVGVKDGAVTTDRLVFTQWTAAVKPTLPDGDGEATITAEGGFVDHLFFVAP